MARNRRLSIFFWLLALPPALLLAVVAGGNLWIVLSTQSRVYDSAEQIDPAPVGLVLGTSKNVAAGTPNQHFENRLAAAAELYHAGKVPRLLVSGHRDSQYYDETRDMIAKLVELEVPLEGIEADDRGARTLDSVARAASVYGYDRLIIVSDDFHVNRALFIADRLGVAAVALRGEPIRFDRSRRVRMREYLARVKALMDLFLPSSVAPAERALVQRDAGSRAG